MFSDTTSSPDEFALEEAARIRMMLGTARLEPLFPDEEAALRLRLPLWEELLERGLGAKVPTLTDEALDAMRGLLEELHRPLAADEGEVPFDETKHLPWLKEFALEAKLFPEARELRRAREAVEAHYNDGEPFTVLRWLAMVADAYDEAARHESREDHDGTDRYDNE